MSRIHQRLQSLHKEAGDAWFLKVSTGQKYGPVSLATLRQWAAEGRIAADSLVSRDSRSWFPAESLPDLQMDWIVTLPDGSSYGPFNLQATRHLVNIGVISPEAIVRHRHTDRRLAVSSILEAKDLSTLGTGEVENRRVADVLEMAEAADGTIGLSQMVSQLADEARGRAQELKEIRRQLEEEKARRLEAESRCAELEKKLREQTLAMPRATEDKKSELETAKNALLVELENLKKRQVQLENAAAAREQELLTRIRELEEEAANGTELLAQAQEQLRNQQVALRAERERTKAEMAQLSEKLKKTESECSALAARADALAQQVKALEAASSEEGERAAAREKELRERAVGLEKELESAKAENEEIRKELRVLEQTRLSVEQKASMREAELRAQVEHLEKTVVTAREEITRLCGELEKEKARAAESERARVAEQQEYEGKVERLKKRNEDVERELAAMREDLVGMRAALEKKNAEIEALRREFEAEKERYQLTRISTAIRETTEATEWYLKTEDGTVCGPVSLRELVEWAADCRVAPEHEVSNDGKRWIPVASLPELRMEWKVILADGTPYGPLHLFAVQDLIEEGVVAADSEVTNAVTGKVVRADRLYVEEFSLVEEQNRRLSAKIEEMASLLAAERERVKRLEEQLASAARLTTVVLPPKVMRDYLKARAAYSRP
ncbi:MAG: GYF domain-containing protein [Kiritimatiellae bacterium]|nr:GYF domain-containing protein [Kiritimatiellia bacterium]